jgi:ABC-2 type transport system ATP-binding protein
VTDSIIDVSGLEHRFGDFVAVDNISFAVGRGEVYSFLGPNGAGKSTTINILTTLLRPQKGRIMVAGCDVAANPAEVRRSIGIVFQNEVLDRDLTVRETLDFHGKLYSLPREERHAKIDELIRLVELEARRDTRTKYLSGGMRRRLEIARGLMTRPEVLFLDEPTIGLDPQTRMKIWDYIREINEGGTTIFLTTHYMDEADRLSDRIGIIDRGRIVTSGRPSDLKNALGNDMIYLETDENAAAAAVLEDVKSMREVRESPFGLLLTMREDGTRSLPAILDVLKERGIGIRGINMKKPTMDDVFIHHTGREMRDGQESRGRAPHPHARRR